jgi:hypothetical protein
MKLIAEILTATAGAAFAIAFLYVMAVLIMVL